MAKELWFKDLLKIKKKFKMIIGKIGVAYERKVNLGNYEHCQLAAHGWAGVEQGDEIDDCFNLLFDIAKEKVKDNLPPSYKANTPNYTETFTKYGKKVDKSELINTAASIDEDFDPTNGLSDL